ncbi:NUDIX hydrolase [Halobacillus salinus]|uniref:NUDIX domain-containing protein n=1 Tax=Halobacillus salinus TaxID=192814 RepID=A0A4Z0H3G8_9BACI|nr:NUDIX domain-containing protein [Halobacillus salinus]TGB03735.1 NUDIX domain-containing protein [Halobacillus salinus]
MDYIQKLRSMVGKEKVIMVVSGAFIFDEANHVLMQKRSDNGQWGFPGGFMELGESLEDTAKREVLEETGIEMQELELFGIYSGPEYDKTFPNGDEAALVLVSFICKRYKGELVESNEESVQNAFFPLDELPVPIFDDHEMLVKDLLSKKQIPIVG